MLRYWHTARYLRPKQLAAWLHQRATGLRSPRHGFSSAPRPAMGAPLQFLTPMCPVVQPGSMRFLNVDAPVDPRRMTWGDPLRPKLWRYNLHYFDYLHWDAFDAAAKAALIDSWIASNRPGSADAWEPYPTSLRTVNWIKYFRAGATPSAEWLHSLALQLAWL